jgi:SpoU rRNA methylase family enzyme
LANNYDNVFVVLHNVHAVSKVIETAQVVYGLGFKNFVVSRAAGSAAQTGVPDANRLSMKMKRNFMVLPDLDV